MTIINAFVANEIFLNFRLYTWYISLLL